MRFVKVPERNKDCFICDLHHPGTLSEQQLPLSKSAKGTGEPWSGKWSFARDLLRIDVGPYELTLEPGSRGLWAGTEKKADEPWERFVGAVVDARRIASGQPWLGLKLGEHRVRRLIQANADGTLTERDPFDPGHEWFGTWTVDAESGLSIVVEQWTLYATPRGEGVLTGTEHSEDHPAQGFAVVRVRLPGSRTT